MHEDKIVLVTGGDKGIGKAIVTKMASIYKYVIFTFNTNKEGANQITSSLPNTFAFQCNLRNKEQIKETVGLIINQFSKVDILINNAGYDNDAVFTKTNEEQWNSVLDINLRSIFYFTQSFVKLMINNGWGRVLFFTSIAGFMGAFGKANYAASKAGIVGFTKSLAIEVGSKNITVNAIAPGAINTDMLMRIPEKYRNTILNNIPLKRFGEPEEVADLVEFLVSNKAKYINGQTIHINGGSYC